jgi:hypothetical protein
MASVILAISVLSCSIRASVFVAFSFGALSAARTRRQISFMPAVSRKALHDNHQGRANGPAGALRRYQFELVDQ